MSDTVINVLNLTRKFRRTTALDDVSLDVPAGIVMGLVGGNGAGKTTLIKHLLGLLKAKAGSVRVFGLDPRNGQELWSQLISYINAKIERLAPPHRRVRMVSG